MTIRSWIHDQSYRIFPGLCLLCGAPSQRKLDLCTNCEDDLPRLTHYCPYCGEPSAGGEPSASGEHNLPCAACLARPPPFSAVLSPFLYSFPIDSLVLRFKEKRQLAAGHLLTSLAIRHVSSELSSLPRDFIVIPVPLHWRKRRLRGFNQSELIATHVAEHFGVHSLPSSVNRTSYERDQKTLPISARRNNPGNTFHARKKFNGERILIVDDVVTTGSTVTELSRCLLSSGASDVVVFSLARTARR